MSNTPKYSCTRSETRFHNALVDAVQSYNGNNPILHKAICKIAQSNTQEATELALALARYYPNAAFNRLAGNPAGARPPRSKKAAARYWANK